MKETDKMLEIIHNNCKKQKQITKKAEQKKERNKWLIGLLVVGVIILAVMTLYNEKQISNCIESGKSETFCRYAGE